MKAPTHSLMRLRDPGRSAGNENNKPPPGETMVGKTPSQRSEGAIEPEFADRKETKRNIKGRCGTEYRQQESNKLVLLQVMTAL